MKAYLDRLDARVATLEVALREAQAEKRIEAYTNYTSSYSSERALRQSVQLERDGLRGVVQKLNSTLAQSQGKLNNTGGELRVARADADYCKGEIRRLLNILDNVRTVLDKGHG